MATKPRAHGWQGLTFNAVMHLTYENTNAPVRVPWFQDRIGILSPGDPFGVVSAANFGRLGVTDYRNPNLAEALRKCWDLCRGLELAYPWHGSS